MENFSHLLNQHIQRLGISDTELARAIGVSRQTIFRWREGSTARPRHRQDVLAIAKKLRLSPDEQDTLMLAAGFRPENAEPPLPETAGGQPVPATETSHSITVKEATHPQSTENGIPELSVVSLRHWWIVAAIVGLLLAVSGAIWWITANTSSTTHTLPVAPATPNETLVLVTHFANYGSKQAGYNVAGRLAEVLQEEADRTNLQNIRIDVWPAEVDKREPALSTGRQISATLVIYGEYDAGRVVVKMAHPADQTIFADPALERYVADLQDLSTTINSDVPQQIRSLALIALGQIYLRQGNFEQARLLLLQAQDNLEAAAPVDKRTWGLVNFYLGIVYQHNTPPDLDMAIESYTTAIDVWPGMISSLLNRGAAYETRKQPGDLQKALEDAEAVIAIAPDWPSGYNNRASIRLNIGGPENLTLALVDLEQALALNPDLPEAYINQALILFRQGLPMEKVTPVLEKALALRPHYGTALNALCWGYALEQQPQVAMPYCQQAVEANPNRATFQDSRGLAYALMQDYPAAIADFQAYANWLSNQQPGNTWQKELHYRQAWITQLQAGENPFTPELLAELRQNFGE